MADRTKLSIPSAFLCPPSSRQRCIESGWCFNHGRRAHCDVQPPLGSLIVSGQAGSADHPASGMANDSQWGRKTEMLHIQSSVYYCRFVCACARVGDEHNHSPCGHACKRIMDHRINCTYSLITTSQIKANTFPALGFPHRGRCCNLSLKHLLGWHLRLVL